MTPIPKLLTIAGNRLDPNIPAGFSPKQGVVGCPGWTRETWNCAHAVVIRWTHDDGTVLLDLMSRLEHELLPIEVDGVADLVWPLAGRAFESGHPGSLGLISLDPAGVKADLVVSRLGERVPIDQPNTSITGSPRMFAFDPIAVLAARDGGLSETKRQYLGKWVAYQLQRPYQDPTQDGLPTGLLGRARIGSSASAFPGVPFVWAHDTHHFTVDRLATAYELTGSPRALDQLIRLIVHALSCEYYYQPGHGFYGLSPRVPGWLLKAIATTLRVLKKVGGTLAGMLGPRLAAFAAIHVDQVLKRWPVGVWSPFETSDDTGGHSSFPHDVVFMEAILAIGSQACANYGVPGAAKLHARVVDWLESYAWDQTRSPEVIVYYDALRQGGGTSAKEPEGVGIWLIAAMAGTGTELERRLKIRSIETDCWGVPEIDTRNTLFGRIAWVPEGWAAT